MKLTLIEARDRINEILKENNYEICDWWVDNPDGMTVLRIGDFKKYIELYSYNHKTSEMEFPE